MENKNNRKSFKKARFNLLDAIVIIVSLSIFVCFFSFWDPYELFTNTDVAKMDFQVSYLRYDVECIGLPLETLNKLNVGDELMGEDGKIIGFIDEVIPFGYSDNSQYAASENDKKVYIKIITKCFEKESGFIIDGVIIEPDMTISIFLDEDIQIKGKCSSAFLISEESYYEPLILMIKSWYESITAYLR